ncbi:hypothetical protein NL676_036387 [Syzygium grande]|nr:hypothetical protein NL676_036386 [Syzygium grande]KAI6682506.1 hypothetical protein NL676_036387 [Syzygium grande]
MGGFDDYKPVLAMFGLQFTYAGLALFARASLVQGLSPRVFVVYRQAAATLFISPVAFLWRRQLVAGLHISHWKRLLLVDLADSAVITLLLEQDPEAWKLQSKLGIASVLYAGIVGSGISFFVQSWCISQRGPLFSAMFNPLGTVIVTILAAIFLHEEIYTGSLAGAIGVVAGLYLVLWGKAKDPVEINGETEPKIRIDCAHTVKLSVDGLSPEKLSSIKCDLSEPLLSDTSADKANPV